MTFHRHFAGALCCILASLGTLEAAVPRDFVVDLKSTVSDTAPHISLSWTQRIQSNITAQKIHRRLKGETTWVKLADLTTTDTAYIDNTAVPGVEYEYWMQRTLNLTPSTAMGYLSAGVKVPEVHSRGKILLLIDSTMTVTLGAEIDLLKQDLAADGWTVVPITATRTATAASIKGLITTAYNADPTNVKLVYLLGHVPVPYSGNQAPDGHGDHVGAWPADAYYGDMNGTWTDTSVNNTSASRSQNDNIPSDGKFDQVNLPSLVELGVGRVDMYSLSRSPTTTATDIEVGLIRRYLAKAHDFRLKQGAYTNIPRRTLIRDGFGHAFTSEPFALTAWAGAFSAVGHPPASPIDEAPSGQWFSPTYAGGQSYLWGHGCGGGSYEYASSLGTSTDFGHFASRVVFASVFGSYHGDWDADNALMRSVIAGTSTNDSLALCCFWQGRPNWFVHHLGMGETLGYMTRVSMNAGLSGGGSYLPGGSSYQGVHIGLMGDPALRIHAVEPPRKLSATSISSQVQLNWAGSTESGLQGYHVYRGSSVAGPFTKLTNTPQAGTSYTDSTVTAGTAYTYMVRTLKLDTVPGGSYYNLSTGSMINITASSAGTSPPANPTELSIVSQTSSVNAQISWVDNSSDETGFRIERKTNSTGTWATLTTLAANTTTHTDPGPFSNGNVYHYRVIAVSGVGDSVSSNTASFAASSGYAELDVRTLKVNKNAGTAAIVVKRFGGTTGSVPFSYSTANSTALAGTHYTTTSGTLTWADGDGANKTISVPIINNAAQQQARQFTLTLTSPGGNSKLGVYRSISVLIEDSSATLSSPWSQVALGTPTHTSLATDAEGFIGSTMIGGSLTGTSEIGRFIYQTKTGDTSLTAFVRSSSPSNGSARAALMVRETLSANARMTCVATSSSSGTSGYGTRQGYRSTVGGTLAETPSSGNSLITPCWLRITRLGNTLLTEHSPDGTTWTTISQITLSGLSASAYWGFYNTAGDAATSTDYSANFQLSGFENITFTTLPAPAAPDGVSVTSATSSTIGLQWNTKANTAIYRIERRQEGEDFSLLTEVIGNNGVPTQSYTDTTVNADTAYEYRVIASNSAGASPPSASVVSVTAPGDLTFVRTTQDAGGADATVKAATPADNFGTLEAVTVAGLDPVTDSLTSAEKTYLRFDLTGFSGTVKSAKLDLGYLGERAMDITGLFIMNVRFLTTDISDTWDESTISWNNAPQNDTAGTSVLTPYDAIGSFSAFSAGSLPAVGSSASLTLTSSSFTPTKIGTNNQVTFVLFQGFSGAQVDWAAKEHASIAPPKLTLSTENPQLSRPAFFTATPGASSGFNLTWYDATTGETGFQLERRAANAAWTRIQTLPADSTSFNDTATLPGVIYEYRLRATNPVWDSSWVTASAVRHSGLAAITAAIQSPDGTQITTTSTLKDNVHVPPGFMFYPPAQNFVSSQSLSTTLRNNFNGWLGTKITIGNTPIALRELGRWVLAGNSGTHTVKIVDAATNTDVPGGSVSIATSGASPGFKYAPLNLPVTLNAGASYYIVSQETSGGDQWYDGGTSLTYATSIATVNQAVSSTNGVTYSTGFSAGNSYIPVTFRYSPVSAPFITSHNLQKLRNDYTGWLGMSIVVGSSALTIDSLGRWVVAGNSGTHQVRLIEASTGTQLASVSVATAGAPAGQFKYAPLSSSVTLLPAATYHLLSQETAGGDQWLDFPQATTGSPSPYQEWLLSHGLPMDASDEGSATATPADDGLPNLIKYALGLDPQSAGHSGNLANGTVEDGGNSYLTFTYKRPEPAPAGVSYAVHGCDNLTASNWSTTGISEIQSTVDSGFRTITVKDSTPISPGSQRYLRLNVSQP